MKQDGVETSATHGAVSLHAAIQHAIGVGIQRAERVFVVGGVVRDLLMQRAVGDHDLDLVVEGDGPAFAQQLSSIIGGTLTIHTPFLTAKIKGSFAGHEGAAPFAPYIDEVDIATARTESYHRPGALPEVSPAPIERDLWRRDFSINAMALPLAVYAQHLSGSASLSDLAAQLVDPCDGCAALRAREVRILHPASFIDDPTRLFRAVRYCARHSFGLDAVSTQAFHEALTAGCLCTISPRRVWNEVLTALDEAEPQRAIAGFVERGLLSHLPLVAPSSLARVTAGLERLMPFRHGVAAEAFKDAAKQVLLAFIPDVERAQMIKVVQERRALLQRVQAAVDPHARYRDQATLLAAYGVHGSPHLLQALHESVGVVS